MFTIFFLNIIWLGKFLLFSLFEKKKLNMKWQTIIGWWTYKFFLRDEPKKNYFDTRTKTYFFCQQ